MVVLVIVKWTIWAVFLGSGTSGGVLAPLFMIGAAVGGIGRTRLAGSRARLPAAARHHGRRSPERRWGHRSRAWCSPRRSREDYNVMLPLLVASVIAHGFTSLTMRRSILTEKVARRGYHLTREYAGRFTRRPLRARREWDSPSSTLPVNANLDAEAPPRVPVRLGRNSPLGFRKNIVQRAPSRTPTSSCRRSFAAWPRVGTPGPARQMMRDEPTRFVGMA